MTHELVHTLQQSESGESGEPAVVHRQSRRTGHDAFVVMLGPIYGELTPTEQKYILDQIRDIARVARALLAERAALVRKVWVVFGESVMWDIDF